ncbi:MAG: HD domain-containing protein [Desulfobacteraceae bacterium]
MKRTIEKPLLKSLALMASIIEARDAYTGGHLWRVSQYAAQLAEKGNLPADMVFLARLGGFMHDIGKVGIPDGVLGKRGRLTPAEFQIIRTHPGIGAMLIQEHPLGDLALQAVHQHHEWVDGRGYPEKLQGEAISILARIVSIADAFDALTSSRPYRSRVFTDAAVSALQIERRTQFDSQLLDTFVGLAASGALDDRVGHSEWGVALVECPNCGPVITINRDTRDGDTAVCRVCGSKHRLHRQEDGFAIEPLETAATADELKPRAEVHSIDELVRQAPAWVDI